MKSGLDPEILVTSGDFLVPASKFLDAPIRDARGILNPVSFDNAAIEIRPVAGKDAQRLARRTGRLLALAMTSLGAARRRGDIPEDARVSLAPAGRLTPEDSALESVATFGCSPSRLVADDYSVMDVVPVVSARETAVRSAGFHVHQELLANDTEILAVILLDGLLGLLDVEVNDANGWSEQSVQRRCVLGYGRAGEYRARTISRHRVLEYRTLSPWPMANPALVRQVVAVTRFVCCQSFEKLMAVAEKYPQRAEITTAINTSNQVEAARLRKACIEAWTGTVKNATQRLMDSLPERAVAANLDWSGATTATRNARRLHA